MKTFLGIDVGSISTKLVLIDINNQVLFSLYSRTEGNPIGAVQKGFWELKNWISNHNSSIEIAGVGTTGSARYLAGV
ncbi:MAG: 2-hydroxyglutaryl-CoA dehydratase, partial [bacterium]|nr:2-hydroxyglutaryl-CoA dehydratase [bacterium]